MTTLISRTILPRSSASGAAAFALLLGCALAGCNSTPDDAALTNNVQTALKGDAAISQQPVQVAVHGGIVTLTGQVSDGTASSVAANDAARVKGVKQVINSLTTAASQMGAVAPLPASPGTSTLPAPQPAPVSRAVAPVPSPAEIRSTPAPAPVASTAPAMPPAPVLRDVTAPAGTVIPIRITETLSSQDAQDGQPFNGTVTAAVVRNGLVIIPAGSAVSGRVIDAKDAGHFKGHSALSVELTSVRRYGTTLPIASTPYTVEGKNRGKNSAVKIGGGAAVGAVLGGIFGGGKGAAIGSLAGGGGGAAYQGLTRGQQVSIPSESLIRFRLARALTVRTSDRATNADAADRPVLHER